MIRFGLVGAALSTALLLLGCAPSFVGEWQAQPTPDGMRSVTLDISKDGSYAGRAVPDEGEADTTAGRWTKLSSDRALLRSSYAPRPATIAMTAKDRLVYSDDSQTTTFVRQRSRPTAPPAPPTTQPATR